MQRPDANTDKYGSHVIVRLRADWVDQQPDNYDLAGRVDKLAAGLRVANAPVPPGAIVRDRDVWQRVSKIAPGLRFEQVLTRPLHEQLRARAQRAGRAFRLRYFLTVACPAGVKPVELVSLLKQLSFVTDAYEDPKTGVPSVGTCPSTELLPPLDPEFALQGYMNIAPGGIDALFLREHWPGGRTSRPGMGVHIADVEQGWNLAHEDFPSGIPIYGENDGEHWYHGTAVFGIIVAQPNTKGCLGIAPGTQMIAVSHAGRSKTNAIGQAISTLSAGDVLLLETTVFPRLIFNPSPGSTGPQQRDDIPLPVEASAVEKILIEDAVKDGITVVEAAGNASIDLDTVFDLSNTRVFTPARDSGAIIVAASTKGVPHTRLPASNFGTVVSCYAWGEDVRTCWFDPDDPAKRYGYFRNTSAAAAIIAGAAAAAQSFAVLKTGAALSPAALRQLLRNGGTMSADRIGVMPDLKKVVSALCATSGSPPAAPSNLRIN